MSAMSARMQVYSFVNQKGGCGKTTVAVNLAGAFAARGDRVLLVDLDPQAHATMALGCAPEEGRSIGEVLAGRLDTSKAVLTAPGGIDLLPSTPRLGEIEEQAERAIRPERRLADALSQVAGRYSRVLLDCPPRTDGLLCANALCASTTAVLVVETGAFALQGALQAMSVLEEARRGTGYPFEVAVLATMFDRRLRIARELLVALHSRFGELLLDSVIRNSVRLREAPAHGLPVQLLDPSSRATGDFAGLAEEVVALDRALPSAPRGSLTVDPSGNVPLRGFLPKQPIVR
jgi:chromosome partitioning protein